MNGRSHVERPRLHDKTRTAKEGQNGKEPRHARHEIYLRKERQALTDSWLRNTTHSASSSSPSSPPQLARTLHTLAGNVPASGVPASWSYAQTIVISTSSQYTQSEL